MGGRGAGGGPAATDLTGARGLSRDPAVREIQIENRIRAAYNDLPKAPGGWVGLADLRERMAGRVDRAETDATLRRLSREPGIRLANIDNTKSLDSRDHAAAVRIGDRTRHMIAFGRSGGRMAGETSLAPLRPLPKKGGTS